MENMRVKMVALLLMMVFVSAQGKSCFNTCMKRCSGSIIGCLATCIRDCAHKKSSVSDVASPAAEPPSSAASYVLQRGGSDLEEGEQ